MSTSDPLVRSLLLIIAVIVLLPVLMMAVMMPMIGMWGGGHMWNGGMWNGGMWDGTGATWMWIGMWVIVLAIIVGIGYLLYRAVQSPTSSETDPAIEELRNAYARGEISDEEFEKRRERLQREE